MYIDGLVQDCSISIANALEMLQACINVSFTVNPIECAYGMKTKSCDNANFVVTDFCKLHIYP